MLLKPRAPEASTGERKKEEHHSLFAGHRCILACTALLHINVACHDDHDDSLLFSAIYSILTIMSGGPGQDKAALSGLGGQGYGNENSGA